MVAETTNGLALAEHDLRLRGPGDYFGVRQSGLPELKVARLDDAPLVEAARAAGHGDPGRRSRARGSPSTPRCARTWTSSSPSRASRAERARDLGHRPRAARCAPRAETRPTADLIKGAIFSMLEALAYKRGFEPDEEGNLAAALAWPRVLDLFAGSGGAGHRGAQPRRAVRGVRRAGS